MPDKEILNVLTIKCNTINMSKQNKEIYNKMEDDLQCINKMQEAVKPKKYNANTTGIPNSNSRIIQQSLIKLTAK